MEYSFYDFLKLIGSLGLFLYGMKIMSEGLQKVAGDRLRSILTAMTTNRVTGVLTGVLITALIQSSSATTVMVVSFVNAGLLTLAESISVIMGANIGTTFTAWIMSLGYNVDLTIVVFPAFFLGIMLSIVFIIAAVLIIYYKQISEGYEDQSRFEIMQKVGMTKKDIRKSINSQMLTVFFLPLLFAIVHLGFAFPIINKLLLLFGLDNLGLLLLTAAISALVFALFYIIVYRVTSNAYYSIVSGAKE